MLKRALICLLCVCLLGACAPAETGAPPPAPTGGSPTSSAPPETESPSDPAPPETVSPSDPAPPNALSFAERVYNSAMRRDFLYNPDDGCYYISIAGETYPDWLGDGLPWDVPEIERFCKIHAVSGEVTVLSDGKAANLVYSDGYVYYYDAEKDGRILRTKGGAAEEVFVLSEHVSRDTVAWYGGFFVEHGLLYLRFRIAGSSVRVYDLATLTELPHLRYDTPAEVIQIADGVICAFSQDGLQWRQGDGELQRYASAADLVRSYSGADAFPWIKSFRYLDGLLLVSAEQDLLLIRPEEGTLAVIDSGVFGDYAVHDGAVYYCAGDALYTYAIATGEKTEIISFYEGRVQESDDDYYGLENLAGVRFVGGNCFLTMTGIRTYSPYRIAALDLERKAVTYLTDRFAPRTNRMTSSAMGVLAYEYPNDYGVFNDYGSAGGTLISSLEKRLCIQINPMRYLWGERAIADTAAASELQTAQGYPLYYAYGEDSYAPLAALITDGETYVNININGTLEAVRENEAELLAILQSIQILAPM